MKKSVLLFIAFFTATILWSQTTIKGIVTDKSGEPIIGANVFLKDTYDGTSTEADGSFEFATTETGEAILAITYIGFEDFEQAVQLNGGELEINPQIEETANELNMVTISAGAFEASDEKKAVMLSPLDIVTTAGATADIAGALNTLPGTQAVGEEGQLFVRGGAAYETRTFIDGLFVQNPYSSRVPDIPARGRFSPFLFKGTMFSTGGYSAEYGQALSSALILNTNDLATATTTGISLMTVGLGASHTHLWDKSSLALSGNYINVAPYNSIVPQDRKWDKPFRGYDGQIIYRKETSETGIFKLNINGSHGSLGLQTPGFEDVTKTNAFALGNDNFYLNSSFKEILDEHWTLRTGLSYSYDKEEIRELFSVNTNEQSAQAKITLTNNVGQFFKIKFGGEYLLNLYDQKFISSAGEEFTTDLTDNYGAGFAEADIYLSKDFVARLGTRTEYSDMLEKWNIAPRISLAYKTGKKGQFSLAYGQFFQTPEKELLRFGTNLNYEKADHYLINYQILGKKRTFRIEGYYKTYDNLVKQENFTTNNSGNGHARGFDIFYRDKGGTLKKADFWISYSFLDTERDWREFPQAATPTFASRHNASIVYKQWLPKITSSIGFTYSYASPRPYNDPNTDGFNEGRTPAYHDLSFNISYLTNIKRHFTVLYASVNNIPGFKNKFGYRYSNTPNDDGTYTGIAVKPAAKRFFFVGCFISIGQRFSKDNGVTSGDLN
ncbi:MAG TPA: TonB-dependent receptor [Bacteroidetes bacterium]|nr:TonB-dependent receptor [Bacteroidota bacterium]